MNRSEILLKFWKIYDDEGINNAIEWLNTINYYNNYQSELTSNDVLVDLLSKVSL
jgi:hypothetical protein